MKNTFKKVAAALIAVTSLSLCTVANMANATTGSPDVNSYINEEENITPRNMTNFTLNSSNQVLIDSIDGYAKKKIYAGCTGRSIRIYVKDATGNVKYSRTFYTSAPQPALEVEVPANKTYYVYAQCDEASSSNTISAYVNIYT